jgi:hypothetical protein
MSLTDSCYILFDILNALYHDVKQKAKPAIAMGIDPLFRTAGIATEPILSKPRSLHISTTNFN